MRVREGSRWVREGPRRFLQWSWKVAGRVLKGSGKGTVRVVEGSRKGLEVFRSWKPIFVRRAKTKTMFFQVRNKLVSSFGS